MTLRLKATILGAALSLGLAAVVPAQEASGSPGIFNQLAGPGGKVTFVTGPHPESGEPASVKASTSPEGGFRQLEAHGELTLESPQLYLECLHLVFDAAAQTIFAQDRVVIRQEGVNASADEALFHIDTGSANLTGTPKVDYATEDNRLHFDGMQSFQLDKDEDGGALMMLRGPREISINIETKSGTTASGDPTEGFAGLGDTVQIYAAPRGTVEPEVSMASAGEGEMGRFHATGSIRLNSETFDLRCDELTYDAAAGEVEALYNVYIKKQGIEADCGRMLYDLATGKITLTVDPDIRQQDPSGTLHIWNMDSFIIEQRSDGTIDTDIRGGPDDEPRMEFISAPETKEDSAPTESTPSGPTEINLDDPGTLPRP
ncbi:hypothetical protein KQI84_09835 [bacterium]|nr:hypothetical protein [bacterium]